MANITDSPNPNVQLLYDIIETFFEQNDITVVELMGIFEVIKVEQIMGSATEEEEDED